MNLSDFIKPGDVIVGSFNDVGTRLQEDNIVGDQAALVASMERSMSRVGKPLKLTGKPVKGRKTAKPVKQSYATIATPQMAPIELEIAAPQRPVETKKIFLHNEMGKIKMKVEEVIECEMAYCLIFSHEDDIIFTPKLGDSLTFTNYNGDSGKVYFAGTLFTWVDGVKQLMVLVKD